MSYEIDRTDKANYGSITVEDQTINQETSLQFIGKNYTGYAKVLAENFLHLLENFAKSTPPTNPVPGQLWYDTNLVSDPPQPQLKVWDGSAWTAAGNVKKSISRPLAQNAVIGDLWVDTANNQLYLWSGSNWILVGPQYSDGSLSGPVVDTVYDTLNAPHVIIKFLIKDKIVAIISTIEFTPKSVIEGFSLIKPGFNLSNYDFDANGVNDVKVWGTAEKADALLVGAVTVPSANFLRSDVISTTNFGINIRNNAGLAIGSDLTTSLSNTASGEAILYNKTEGSRIFLRINQAGAAKDVLTVFGTKVGINKTDPSEALDVNGKIRTSDSIVVTGSTDSTTTTTGSIKTAGGLAVVKSVNIGQTLTVAGSSNTGTIIPNTNNSYDLGSSAKKWRSLFAEEVTATTFYGNFTGQFAGSVTGSASRLTSPTEFSIIGDITSNTISFNGQQPSGTAIFNTSISQDVIASKTEVTDSLVTDEFLINRSGLGLRKITKQTALANVPIVPIGAIFPYAGTVPPRGYLFCDGSEQLIANYPELFSVLGYTYKAVTNLLGLSTFAIPDLRGRFGLGRDNMNNNTTVASKVDGTTITTIASSANRVTDTTADNVGQGAGTQTKTLSLSNIPDHEHDLKGNAGGQYYAFRNVPGTPGDTDATSGNGPTGASTGQYLSTSGGIKTAGSLGQPVDVLNPYLTINYIIFTGKL